MKKNTKRIIASAALIGMISAGTAFAAENVDTTAEFDGVVIRPSAQPTSEEINGAVVKGVEVKEINGVKMIPLRLVGEGLGYSVNWNDENRSIELIKGAQYIKMAIDKDSYAFSRRSGEPLGAAPTLVDDSVTYVPLSFITEIIGGYYNIEADGTYKIVNPSIVSVTSINENGSLTVSDSYLGEVIVNIGKETRIFAGDKEVSASEIKPDMVLGIEYGEAMTASLPPQTTAERIIIENLPTDTENDGKEAEFGFSGTVTEIEDGMITVGEPTKDADSVRLVITDDTVITRGKNGEKASADEIKVGSKISGTHAEAVTMSIPPQTVAIRINID